ncbi:MAG: PAS domain S-box protein, partial [Desulfobacterales bacterium]|nr:PAS domain S-box protein [Desulfobacterales bacterium]
MSSSFGDLIDLDALKNMVESNYRASGVPVGVIDAVSGEVYAGAGWQRICTEFHRKHPETNALCIESDTKIAGKIKKGDSLAYKCENGLWDIGIPVICDGIHIVTIFLGQFRYEDEILDKSLFQKRAQKYGFPTEAYMSALDEVPVFSREKVALILDYNQAFARFLSSQIDDKLRYKKEAEQRKKAESMHSDLFHNAAVGVVYQDNTGAIINANEASQKILGLSLPQMQGRKSIDPMWKTIYPDGSPFPGEEHPAMVALNTGKPVHDVVMGVYNPEDNQNHWLLINAIPQFHEKDSAPYQVFSTFNDITQRVLAEENLQNLNRDLENKVRMRTNQLSEKISELEALFNNSQVGIMALKGGRFLDRGNQRLADILGYDSPEEMTGISMQQLHLSEQRFHEFGEKYYNRLSQKEMLQIEYQLKKKDGTSVWCILSGKALDPETPTDLDKGVIWLVDDISTRKRAEKERKEVLKKLQNSEKDYKNLVDNSPEILYRFSEKAGGFFVSKRVEEILGYPVQYLMENPFVWNQSIHPEDQKKVENTIFQAKAGKSFDIEYRIKDKFGKWHWFQDRSIVITEGDNEFVIEGLAADITERKKNDMALLDVTRKLEMANKLGKSGWWEYDVEKDAVIWPRETYELYGLDPEMDQLEYSDLMQCILPEFHDYHNAQLERIYTEGECEFLYPIRHPDGNKRWIWAKGEADYNKDGEPVRLFGTLQDITERKKIEEKLQLQSQIISQVHDSVISVDLNGTITTWNKGSEALFQYTAQEIIGNHVSQVYPKAFHEKLENQIIPQLLSKGGLEYETKLVRKDGNEFHALISLSVLKNQRDEIYGMIGYTIDISNRKDA